MVPQGAEFALKAEGGVNIANLTMLQVVNQVYLSVGKFLAVESLKKLRKSDGSEYDWVSLNATKTPRDAKQHIQTLGIDGLCFQDASGQQLFLVNIAEQLQALVRQQEAAAASTVITKRLRGMKARQDVAKIKQGNAAAVVFQSAFRRRRQAAVNRQAAEQQRANAATNAVVSQNGLPPRPSNRPSQLMGQQQPVLPPLEQTRANLLRKTTNGPAEEKEEVSLTGQHNDGLNSLPVVDLSASQGTGNGSEEEVLKNLRKRSQEFLNL